MTPDVLTIVKELQAIPETVTDWDLCPFCIRQSDENVGQAYERHKTACIRPHVIAALLEREEKLAIAIKALETNITLLQTHWMPSSGGCTFCEGGRIDPCPANTSYRATQEALQKIRPQPL